MTKRAPSTTAEKLKLAEKRVWEANEAAEAVREELEANNEELKALNERLGAQNDELARSNSDIVNLMASVRLPLIMFDRHLCIRRFSVEAERIFQLVPSDVGQSIKELALDFAIPNLISKLTAVIETGLPQEQEIRNREGHWFVLRMNPELGREPEGKGVVMVLVDIDELKRNQLQLTVARDYSNSIVSTIDDALVVLDARLSVVSANPAYYAFFQVDAAATVGGQFDQLGDGQWNRPELMRLLDEAVKTHSPFHDFELEASFPRIGDKILRLRAQPIRPAAGGPRLVLLAISDVTERRLAAKALAISEQRFRDSSERLRFMAESMPQKIFTVQPRGEVDYFNQQWLEFTGLAFEEIRGWGWKQLLHPEDRDDTLRQWTDAVVTGAPYLQEHRFRRADGVYRWHLSRAAPMRDAEGKIIMWIGSSTEIHDQKQAEERLEEAVEKRTVELRTMVGELETFSYTLTHDLRGPLRTMQGFADVLRDDYSAVLDANGRRYVGKISAAAGRMQQLVGDVLIFTRMTHQPLPVEPVDLNLLVAIIAEQYLAFESSEVRVQANLGVVIANAPALTQAVSNLLHNALKFIAAGRKPEVEVSTRIDGEWSILSITDNGIGIADADQARIFRMFERAVAPDQYEGAGIGLAIVQRTVERMGGTVGVSSTPGKGSVFWIRLRAGQLPAEAAGIHSSE